MLTLISPAKSLDFDQDAKAPLYSSPRFLEQSCLLTERLKKKKPRELQQLMSISPKLAQLNHERFQVWTDEVDSPKAKPALLVFKGDVYIGLEAEKFTDNDLQYAQQHLRILSGLYGILRPLDNIQAYRLEMGTALKYRRKNDLYQFWGDSIRKEVQQQLDTMDQAVLINLASNEYFKSVQADKLKARIITPVFKDFKNGEYKFLSFFAKKARGMMTRYIMQNRIEDPEKLKLFEEDGYYYNDRMSEGDTWIFTRG